MPFTRIDNWSGGLSDSDKIGVKGSFAEGVGLDIHSLPGILKVNQALKKESGSVVIDLCKFAFNCSDGNSYWFGNTGKIYKRTSAGSWSNVYTDSDGEIKGAAEFDGYIFWATDTSLKKMIIGGNWSTDVTTVGTLDSADYHPMVVQGLYLIIGNKRKLATVEADTGTFTSQGIPDVTLAELPADYEIKTLINFGIDILVGTKTTNRYTSARIFRWDISSPAYISDDDIPEDGLNCFIPSDNYVYVQAGKHGNIYQYTGEALVLRKRISGDYDNKSMEVLPQSYTSFRGMPLFGVSNNSGNPVNQGIYSLYKRDINYPLALNLEYVLSSGLLSGLKIGAMLSLGNDFLVAWYDGTNYGVDIIDWNNKYNNAYYKSLIVDGGERQLIKHFKDFSLSYYSKPSGTDIGLAYIMPGGSEQSIGLNDDITGQKKWASQAIDSGVLQFKISFTTSGNNAPEIEELYIDFDYKDNL